MTVVQILINSSSHKASREATAKVNGMTVEQVAASEIVVNRKELHSNPEIMTILANRETAIAALDRIAAIEATEEDSVYISTEDLAAVILA